MVNEAFKKTGLQCYSKNFGLKKLYILLLKSVITKAQEYEVSLKFKVYVCVAMCSLVMSLNYQQW